MMDVNVVFYHYFLDITDKLNKMTLSLTDQASIKDVVNSLSEKFGDKFRNHVFSEPGVVNNNVVVLINNEDIRNFDGMDTKLKADDRVSFLPFLTGGWSLDAKW